MGKTAIEWTDFSWNPIRARHATHLSGVKIGWHCEHVSDGCRSCYAESINRRLGTGLEYKPGHRGKVEIFLDEKMLSGPMLWKKPRNIFVCSMTDLFADFVPDAFIARMFAIMALCHRHTFQILTKRPERMRDFVWRAGIAGCLAELYASTPNFAAFWPFDEARAIALEARGWAPRNVWLGVSVEDQDNFDKRVPQLLGTPAAIRFLSVEPMLGPIDLALINPGPHRISAIVGIDWVICGGESGHGARMMNPDWARGLRDQCNAFDVPFFMKQMTKKESIPADLMVREFPKFNRTADSEVEDEAIGNA